MAMMLCLMNVDRESSAKMLDLQLFHTISTFFAIMRPEMLENTFVRSGAECFAKVLDGRGGRATKRLGPKLGS